MPSAAMVLPNDEIPSNGGRMIATDGRSLPMKSASVRCEAGGGIARVVLEQRFANPYDEPLRITYLVPVPEEAAVSGYAFRLGDRTIRGVVESREAARQRFERAIVDGRSAALLEQDRGSLFSQELGNVPPRAEVTCILTLDQALVWIDDAWEWRFPTVVSPRYLGEPGRTPDAARIVVPVAEALPVAMSMSLSIADALTSTTSPSHAIDLAGAELKLAKDAALDRDLVVRWGVTRPTLGATIRTTRTKLGAYGLVTIVPPTSTARAIGRDVCILLDTSGSMSGAPLDQARRVSAAIIDSLGDDDQLEMIEFSDKARRWNRSPVQATTSARRDALLWLGKLSASSSTDMTAGIIEALGSLRADAQRQVVLVTDGQIGFEAEILREICAKLPKRSRLHTVGVGSGVNRSLTGPAARAGNGLEVVLGLDEDPEPAARRIVRRTTQPLVMDVELSGSALVAMATRTAADLFAGSPALVPVELKPEGGELVVRGKTATETFETRVVIDAIADGSESIAALWARERVADRELSIAAGVPSGDLETEIERIGLSFGIATRLTSFVAVSDEVTVDPLAPTRREEMPHELPYGVSATGLGLRVPSPPSASSAPSGMMAQVSYAPAPAMDELDASLFSEKRRSGALGGVGAPPPPRSRSMPAPPPPRSRSVPAPPLAPAPAAKKPAAPKESIVERIRRVFSKKKKLVARVVLRDQGRVVVELTADERMTWDVPSTMRLGESDLAIDSTATTKSCELLPGQTVRITILDPTNALDAGGELAHEDLIIEVAAR